MGTACDGTMSMRSEGICHHRSSRRTVPCPAASAGARTDASPRALVTLGQVRTSRMDRFVHRCRIRAEQTKMDASEVIALHRNGASRCARGPAGAHARARRGKRESYHSHALAAPGNAGPIHSGVGVCPGDGVSRATTRIIRQAADGATVVRDVDIPWYAVPGHCSCS